MALRLIYQTFSKLLSWIVLHARSDTSKEIDILVLRHQLAVLQRRTPTAMTRASRRGDGRLRTPEHSSLIHGHALERRLGGSAGVGKRTRAVAWPTVDPGVSPELSGSGRGVGAPGPVNPPPTASARGPGGRRRGAARTAPFVARSRAANPAAVGRACGFLRG